MDLRRLAHRIALSISGRTRRGPLEPRRELYRSRERLSRGRPTAAIDLALGDGPLPELEYAPRHDGDADPGEVVWAWVPYEDDPRRGKDRPVLIVGRTGGGLVGLMLSSKDHDLDAEDEARFGRHWLDIGSGGWDHRRRPSEVRLDRILSLPPERVRREGAALPAPVFARVVAALRELHGG